MLHMIFKLGPVPVGGWCNVSGELSEPGKELVELVNKSVEMRLARARYLAETHGPIDQQFENEYISVFRDVEDYLDSNSTIMSPPTLGLDVVSGVDWENAKKKRRRNWLLLNEMIFGNMVKPFDRIDSNTVPLGYVIRVKDRDRIRSALAGKRVFCPVHWPLPAQVDRSDFQHSYELSASCLTLPIDQRYDKREMNRIANLVRAEL